MAKDNGNGGGGYNVPSTSTGKIAALSITKNQTTPKKTTGGDLRSK